MLYSNNFSLLPSERERIEVYLAAASLEESEFNNVAKASELLKLALNDGKTQDSRPYVALARLGSESGSVDDNIVRKRLKEICTKQVERVLQGDAAFPVKDGRLFNAWAKLESKSGRLKKAKDVLRQGMQLYPEDHTVRRYAWFLKLLDFGGVLFVERNLNRSFREYWQRNIAFTSSGEYRRKAWKCQCSA